MTVPVEPSLDEPPTDEQPCHTGRAAHTCGYDAALNETDVDTAELAAVTA